MYTKTVWTNNMLPSINATNLNKLEQGIYDNSQSINNLNIPTKTSDLTNDSDFITNSVDNLTNYYNITDGQKKITSGTTLPSTGTDGDIFLLYEA